MSRLVMPHPPLAYALAGILVCSLTGIPAQAQTQNTTYSYQYDANGNLTQITDPLGHVTNHTYDALNRLTQQLQPAPVVGAARPAVQYGYNGQDRLVTVTDPRNLTTSYTVDGLGNQTAVRSPDTGTATTTYDAAGNLKTVTDARGKTTTYSYDALNRVTAITYASGTATTFVYDTDPSGAPNTKGRLVKMSDESGSTLYSYDALGRITGKTQAMGSTGWMRYTVNYAWGGSGSAAGHVTSITYPSGNRIGYSYDAAGRIAAVMLNPVNASGAGTNENVAIPLLNGIQYAPFGLPLAWTWGNSSGTEQNTYARSIDLNGRITAYPLGNALANGANRTVNYDAASRITGTSHTGPASAAALNQGYGYDNLDRLTSLIKATSSQGYQYDATGNRTQWTLGSTSYSDTIDTASNRLTATSGPVPAKSNSYDAAGNLTGDGTNVYTYSARGRLSQVLIGTRVVTYLYNGWGQRVSKASNQQIATGGNHYVYDEAGHVIGEYDWKGQPIEETVYLGDMPVAVLTPTVTGTAPNTVTTVNVHYVYADHLNAPRVIVRASDNKMVWRWDDSDPFGVQRPDNNPSGLGTFVYNLRFPGQVFDQETLLHYNMHRDYDPATGRYIQSDPIGLEGGINTYGYVENGPTNGIDPDGLDRICINGVCTRIGPGPIYNPQTIPSNPNNGMDFNDGDSSRSRDPDAARSRDDSRYRVDPILAAPGNVADTQIVQDYGRYASGEKLCGKKPDDPCDWLRKNAGKYSKERVKATEKAWGCRGSRHGKGGKDR
jgi:RHS repeat-associated protein